MAACISFDICDARMKYNVRREYKDERRVKDVSVQGMRQKQQ